MPHREDEVEYVQNLWGTYDYDLEKSFEQNVELAKQNEALITIEKLLNIEAGITKVEKQEGPAGEKGEMPRHRWDSQTQISFENPDGTWGESRNLNPETVILHQESFVSEEGQETFKLTKGGYIMGTNAISWYLDGMRQTNDSLIEVSPNEVRIEAGVPGNRTIQFDYVEFANVALGLKGDKGEVGPGVDIISGLSSEDELPVEAKPGDAYLIDGNLYVWREDSFVNVGNIRGPQGDAVADSVDWSGVLNMPDEVAKIGSGELPATYTGLEEPTMRVGDQWMKEY